MSDVEILSNRVFSDIEKEILDSFVDYQQALIDKDEKKLKGFLAEDYILIHMSGKKQTKSEFIGEVMDGTLNYFKSEIDNPSVLFDDEDNATFIADVTLTARVYGIDGVWTLDCVIDFKKIDGVWIIGKWDT